MRREWSKLESEFDSYPEFRDFVREIQDGRPALTP
jgi:hypothetical protein